MVDRKGNWMLVVNLYGGPGTGKSTLCAELFSDLKQAGHNVEMAREFAKDIVWSRRFRELSDQAYLLGEQHHRLWVLKDRVDIALTDSPLLQSLPYAKDTYDPATFQAYENYVKKLYAGFHNLNIFVVRCEPFRGKGRVQKEERARRIDDETLEILKNCSVPYWRYSEEDNNYFMFLSLIRSIAPDSCI